MPNTIPLPVWKMPLVLHRRFLASGFVTAASITSCFEKLKEDRVASYLARSEVELYIELPIKRSVNSLHTQLNYIPNLLATHHNPGNYVEEWGNPMKERRH